MSETLRVLLKGVELDASQREEFERQYRVAASTVVPPSSAAALRLVFRAEPNETSIEPFLGSAACRSVSEAASRSAPRQRDLPRGAAPRAARLAVGARRDPTRRAGEAVLS
jgi:hypothetical protein